MPIISTVRKAKNYGLWIKHRHCGLFCCHAWLRRIQVFNNPFLARTELCTGHMGKILKNKFSFSKIQMQILKLNAIKRKAYEMNSNQN